MRKAMFAVPAALAICLACSSGRPRPASPPPPLPQDNSLRDVFLRLGKGMCGLRPAGDAHWVIEFGKGSARKILEVERVGTDFVRLTDGDVRFDLPFSAIVLVTSDS